MANRIEIYQKNTKTINCVVSGLSLTGYTPTLTVKSKTTDASIIGCTGVISDSSTATFYLSSVDTSVLAGDYIYDIVIEKDSSIYTVVKDAFKIVDGVKY